MMEIFKIAKENNTNTKFTQKDFESIQTLYNDSRHQLFFSFKQRYTKSKSDILFFNNFLTNIYVEFINLYDDKVYNQIIEYIEPKISKKEFTFNEDYINTDNVIFLSNVTINIVKYFSIYMNNKETINESVSLLFNLSTLDVTQKSDKELNEIADKFIENILGLQSILSGNKKDTTQPTESIKDNKNKLVNFIIEKLPFINTEKKDHCKIFINSVLSFTTNAANTVFNKNNLYITFMPFIPILIGKLLFACPFLSILGIPIFNHFRKLLWNQVDQWKAQAVGWFTSTIQSLFYTLFMSGSKYVGKLALRGAVSNLGLYPTQQYRLKNKQYLEILRTFALHPLTCNFIFEYLYDMRQYVVQKISNALFVKYKKRKYTHFTTEDDLSLKHEYISMICEEMLEYIEYKEFEIDIENYFISEKLKNFDVFIKFMISNIKEGKYLMKFTIKHFVKILLRNYLSELLKKYDFETLYQMFNPKDCLKIHNPFSKYYYIRLKTKENIYPKDSFMHHLYLLTNTEELYQYMKKIIKDISSDNPKDIKTILETKINHIDDIIVQNYAKM